MVTWLLPVRPLWLLGLFTLNAFNMEDLRNKFFDECTTKIGRLHQIDMAPHDLFNWITKNFNPKPPPADWVHCDYCGSTWNRSIVTGCSKGCPVKKEEG